MTDLLPVGSLIKLKSNKKLMIIGYLPNKLEEDKSFDYICSNEYGLIVQKDKLIKDKHYFYVDKNEIDEILYIGYHDENFEHLKNIIFLLENKLEQLKKETKELTQEALTELLESIINEIKGGSQSE